MELFLFCAHVYEYVGVCMCARACVCSPTEEQCMAEHNYFELHDVLKWAVDITS